MQPIEIIIELMEQKSLKYNELADFIGTSKGVVSAWKTRKTNPPVEYLVKICRFLDISINQLLEIEEDKLTENEKEMISYFKILPEREQLKFIGKIEEVAERYKIKEDIDLSSTSKIG